MAYNKSNFAQAIKTLRLMISDMGIDGKKAQKLLAHFWILDNEYAVELAKQVHAFVMSGVKPDFSDSLVYARMFDKAIRIINE